MSSVEDFHGLRSDKKLNVDKSSSFINPFELTIDISENAEMSYQSSDDEYVPSFDITLQPNTTVNIEEEEDEGADMNEKDGSDEPAVDMGPGIRRIDATNIDAFMSDRPYLVYMDCLLKLAHTNVRQTCTLSDCHSEVTLKTDNVGSALYLTWVCKNGHVQNKWCSQPLLNRRLHTGDLLLASATVLSGNNFQKIDLFAKVLGLPILSSSTFFKIQRTYIVPSVDHHWTSHLDSVLEEFRGKEVVVFGDGRMDSPGHSAQYCSYTFMEMETKKILSIVTMDKRMTGGKSTNLEKACFEKGLHSLLDAGVNVVEVVTDAHPQIGALMKKPQYRNIKHSLDIWHGTKNIGKKIIQVAQEKGKKNKQLFDWTKDIVNHYWHCASISTTVEEFKGHWIGILHVVNEHQWILSYSDDFENNKCNHGPLPAESNKSYLEKGSDAHIALRGIVLNTRLLNSIHYYLNCRSTADLEIFQNEILAYASKRHSYCPPVYRARNRLAALDHNIHIGRPALTKDDGNPR
ncbi:uncharacterized protein LOC134273936 [Saccostrea cucullata]|uniref:uncharacterized protein LOC134273936 n=1 Tax=Saccostrea cuccullata TaxID=36930 RepID=UPI002ED6BDBE